MPSHFIFNAVPVYCFFLEKHFVTTRFSRNAAPEGSAIYQPPALLTIRIIVL